MPSPLLQLRIPQDLADWLEAKYPSRGEVAEYVRQLLTAEQMKEAVAPLVPAHWSEGRLTDEEWQALNSRQAEGLPADLQDEEGNPLPKPKARRKRKGEVGNPSVSLVDALKASVEAQKATTLPARCNRGACTGTIKPNGRCIRCNQEPLKESK